MMETERSWDPLVDKIDIVVALLQAHMPEAGWRSWVPDSQREAVAILGWIKLRVSVNDDNGYFGRISAGPSGQFENVGDLVTFFRRELRSQRDAITAALGEL